MASGSVFKPTRPATSPVAAPARFQARRCFTVSSLSRFHSNAVATLALPADGFADGGQRCATVRRGLGQTVRN